MESPVPSTAAAVRLASQVEAVRNALLRFCTVLLAVVDLLFGTILITLALATFRQWQALNLALRTITVVWVVAGPVVLASGIAALVSLGRLRPPLWVGGTALISAGSAYVAGVLTHVIPCAGPT